MAGFLRSASGAFLTSASGAFLAAASAGGGQPPQTGDDAGLGAWPSEVLQTAFTETQIKGTNADPGATELQAQISWVETNAPQVLNAAQPTPVTISQTQMPVVRVKAQGATPGVFRFTLPMPRGYINTAIHTLAISGGVTPSIEITCGNRWKDGSAKVLRVAIFDTDFTTAGERTYTITRSTAGGMEVLTPRAGSAVLTDILAHFSTAPSLTFSNTNRLTGGTGNLAVGPASVGAAVTLSTNTLSLSGATVRADSLARSQRMEHVEVVQNFTFDDSSGTGVVKWDLIAIRTAGGAIDHVIYWVTVMTADHASEKRAFHFDIAVSHNGSVQATHTDVEILGGAYATMGADFQKGNAPFSTSTGDYGDRIIIADFEQAAACGLMPAVRTDWDGDWVDGTGTVISHACSELYTTFRPGSVRWLDARKNLGGTGGYDGRQHVPGTLAILAADNASDAQRIDGYRALTYCQQWASACGAFVYRDNQFRIKPATLRAKVDQIAGNDLSNSSFDSYHEQAANGMMTEAPNNNRPQSTSAMYGGSSDTDFETVDDGVKRTTYENYIWQPNDGTAHWPQMAIGGDIALEWAPHLWHHAHENGYGFINNRGSLAWTDALGRSLSGAGADKWGPVVSGAQGLSGAHVSLRGHAWGMGALGTLAAFTPTSFPAYNYHQKVFGLNADFIANGYGYGSAAGHAIGYETLPTRVHQVFIWLAFACERWSYVAAANDHIQLQYVAELYERTFYRYIEAGGIGALGLRVIGDASRTKHKLDYSDGGSATLDTANIAASVADGLVANGFAAECASPTGTPGTSFTTWRTGATNWVDVFDGSGFLDMQDGDRVRFSETSSVGNIQSADQYATGETFDDTYYLANTNVVAGTFDLAASRADALADPPVLVSFGEPVTGSPTGNNGAQVFVERPGVFRENLVRVPANDQDTFPASEVGMGWFWAGMVQCEISRIAQSRDLSNAGIADARALMARIHEGAKERYNGAGSTTAVMVTPVNYEAA
ncbi:MAG: hypothetical protein AAFR11_05665 [Pseudomonadota bacterium]